MIHRVTGHIGEKNGSNYLVLPPDNKLMDKYKEVWGKLKMRLKQLIMIKNLSTTKISWRLNLTQMIIYHQINYILKFPTMTIVARSAFVDDGKFYPQNYLDECLYEL